MTRADIYAAIDAERARQAQLWNRTHNWGYGDCSSTQVAPEVKIAILSEELGEAARALLDGDMTGLRTELIQLAAVAVAWLETP